MGGQVLNGCAKQWLFSFPSEPIDHRVLGELSSNRAYFPNTNDKREPYYHDSTDDNFSDRLIAFDKYPHAFVCNPSLFDLELEQCNDFG